ncbi:hypothetical protein Nepgr_021375 [Nepenthes gracilis]|uniref:Uncharacterized protein n=1 Tax=Nepenthes gracilis TaxID=150966 RepID=A0AAD3SZD7_NEPGR|nr:hypothetical protein Nepgr_021375 [Nepenthes gracilis]
MLKNQLYLSFKYTGYKIRVLFCSTSASGSSLSCKDRGTVEEGSPRPRLHGKVDLATFTVSTDYADGSMLIQWDLQVTTDTFQVDYFPKSC